MVEPTAVCSLGVALTGEPEPTVLGTVHTVALGRVVTVLGRPVCLSCPAGLVTNPACLATYTPHNAVGAYLVDTVAQVWNVVVCCTVYIHSCVAATIVTTTTVSTVEPHLELVCAILGKLGTLLEEHVLNIFVGTIVYAVAVPWRYIETILHAQVLCCSGKVAWDVCVAAKLVARVGHIVVGCLSWPLAETVVVLYDSNTTAHAGSLGNLEPLAWVRRSRWSKTLWVFVTVTPLEAGVGVHTIVIEGVELGLLPL